MSASHYQAHHRAQFATSQEDLITYEELNLEDQQNKRHALSMLSIGAKQEICGLCYWTVESAAHWFLTLQKTQDIRTMTPYLGSMDRIRYHHALRQLTPSSWTPPPIADLQRLFYQALIAPYSLTSLELLTVHLFVHMDDMGILNEWNEEGPQRVHAIAALAGARPGSWLLRRSSVKDSDIMKVRVLCIKDKHSGRTEHVLIAHLYGLGYAQLIGVKSNQQMPFSNAPDQPPLPTLYRMSGSFLDLLYRFQDMMDLDKRI